jgi:hypothetical protein
VSVWTKSNDNYDVFLGETVIPWTLCNGAEKEAELSAFFVLVRRRSDPPEMGVSGEVQLKLKFVFPASWKCVFNGVEAFEGEIQSLLLSFGLF